MNSLFATRAIRGIAVRHRSLYWSWQAAKLVMHLGQQIAGTGSPRYFGRLLFRRTVNLVLPHSRIFQAFLTRLQRTHGDSPLLEESFTANNGRPSDSLIAARTVDDHRSEGCSSQFGITNSTMHIQP